MPLDAKDLNLFKVSNSLSHSYQVQVDLENLDENSLRSLVATQEVKNATKLSLGWKAVRNLESSATCEYAGCFRKGSTSHW